MKKTKSQKGITLISLVVTIVILLILAVVTINAVKGDNIISKANTAVGQYEDSASKEQDILDGYLAEIDEQLNKDELNPKGTIPANATYTKADGTVLKTGDNFPDAIKAGDTYVYGDYKYVMDTDYCKTEEEYENYIKNVLTPETFGVSWEEFLESEELTEEQGFAFFDLLGVGFDDMGWKVEVIDKTKSKYGAILESINNAPIVSLDNTFSGCTSLIVAPKIPESVKDMHGTFSGCTSLATASVIPESVEDMHSTFSGCTSLTTAPTIPQNVLVMRYTFNNCTSLTGDIIINTNHLKYASSANDIFPDHDCYSCFSGTVKPITLKGSASDTVKELLASTNADAIGITNITIK